MPTNLATLAKQVENRGISPSNEDLSQGGCGKADIPVGPPSIVCFVGWSNRITCICSPPWPPIVFPIHGLQWIPGIERYKWSVQSTFCWPWIFIGCRLATPSGELGLPSSRVWWIVEPLPWLIFVIVLSSICYPRSLAPLNYFFSTLDWAVTKLFLLGLVPVSIGYARSSCFYHRPKWWWCRLWTIPPPLLSGPMAFWTNIYFDSSIWNIANVAVKPCWIFQDPKCWGLQCFLGAALSSNWLGNGHFLRRPIHARGIFSIFCQSSSGPIWIVKK
jgi:hypothetical protein